MYNLKRSVLVFFMSLFLGCSAYAQAADIEEYEDYCKSAGGKPEIMPAEIMVAGKTTTGLSKSFCNFYGQKYFVAIGLEAFSSESPNIAATYMKMLGQIDADSPLWQGNNPNPSHNVCKNLGGAAIGFVADGGFAGEKGQTDICVFGDGSMVSGWSLIYMANHREGYDAIKNQVRAEPLEIRIP